MINCGSWLLGNQDPQLITKFRSRTGSAARHGTIERVLHLLWYGLLAILLAAGLFALAARFLPAGEQIAPPLRDEPPWDLPPERALRPEDVDAVRLPVALRGYRFAETDLLLDRLAGELRARDDEIARLRGGPAREAGPAPLEAPARSPYAPPVDPAAGPTEERATEPDEAEADEVPPGEAEAEPVAIDDELPEELPTLDRPSAVDSDDDRR